MKNIIEKIAEYNSKYNKNEVSATMTCCPIRLGGESRIVSNSIYLDLKYESTSEHDVKLMSLMLQSDGSFPEIDKTEGFDIPDMDILIDFLSSQKK